MYIMAASSALLCSVLKVTTRDDHREMDYLKHSPESIARNLSDWFRRSARSLAWREAPTPYRVWVSEIMLQQTTVTAVGPYFQRFMERFPTLEDLARADEPQVLAAWEGLGYYSRARNLLRAARQVVNEMDGRIPSDLDTLRELAGVGAYTAGAIRALAFNLPAPMVDANVRRVLGRLLGLKPEQAGAEVQVGAFSLSLSEAGTPRLVNQALMELGAVVCLPVSPICVECPVSHACIAREEGRYICFGSVPRAQKSVQVREVCVLADVSGRLLICRPDDGRWKGMWQFPRTALADAETPELAAKRLLRQRFGVEFSAVRVEGAIRYRVTRFDTTLHVVRCCLSGSPALDDGRLLVSRADLRVLPLPSPMRRIARAFAFPDTPRLL